jgi:trimethylamine--corrinoid protein Co-methyltransferase
LVIEESYTDAYLETVGWDIPVAIMPMPLMGMTGPASLISTLLLGNCEVLGMLALAQAAAPGTPVIYAPAVAAIEPHTGRYSSGAVEHSLLGAAVTRMARYYHLPAEASTGGTDHHVPGIQAGYERAVNWTLPALAWPDILVGPGLLSGSTVLSLEQMLIDVEVFRRCKRLVRGIESDEDEWLEEVIEKVGPGGSFLSQRSTRAALHGGEWYLSQLGVHDSFEAWEAMGRPDILDEIRAKISYLINTHRPLALDESILCELDKIEQRARRMEKQEQ